MEFFDWLFAIFKNRIFIHNLHPKTGKNPVFMILAIVC